MNPLRQPKRQSQLFYRLSWQTYHEMRIQRSSTNQPADQSFVSLDLFSNFRNSFHSTLTTTQPASPICLQGVSARGVLYPDSGLELAGRHGMTSTVMEECQFPLLGLSSVRLCSCFCSWHHLVQVLVCYTMYLYPVCTYCKCVRGLNMQLLYTGD